MLNQFRWWLLLIAMGSGVAHAEATLRNLRLWQAPDHTRLVFDLSEPVQYQLQLVENPERVVVDFKNASLLGGIHSPEYAGRFLRGIRSGRPQADTLRIVLDLRQRMRPRAALLPPAAPYGHRLVIDLYTTDAVETAPTAAPVTPAPPPAPAARPQAGRFVVAIDAGHGGEDPGATGRRGTQEKMLTLSLARELEHVLNQDRRLRGVLVRSGDYYIPLRRRTALARAQKADLFVSLHADAFPDAGAHGSSVFVLSERGASSEAARWLADKENASDLVGGVSLRDKDELLSQVLLDLSQTKTAEYSAAAAQEIMNEMAEVGRMHSRKVEQAGFAVLKSPDLPSVLVESAFITNPEEEKLLQNAAHRRRMAEAIARGIGRFAERQHRLAGNAPVTPVGVAGARSAAGVRRQ
jgi:N-acetylmuramoyl-L-alanine amidase